MADNERCDLNPECEHGLHRADEHPCGQRAEKAGEPCRYCGDTVPGPEVNDGACPNCWAPITIADAKAMFAPHGLSVDMKTEGSR